MKGQSQRSICHLWANSLNITNMKCDPHLTFSIIAHTWSGYMVRLFHSKANPVQFDRVKPAASLSQQEESSCACMGLRRNFSKDEPESRAHNAAGRTQQSRCGTSRLKVRGTAAETATTGRHRQEEHSHGTATGANTQVRTRLRDKRFLRACTINL